MFPKACFAHFIRFLGAAAYLKTHHSHCEDDLLSSYNSSAAITLVPLWFLKKLLLTAALPVTEPLM